MPRIGYTEPQHLTHPADTLPPGLLRAPLVIRAGVWAGPSEPPRPSKAPHAKTQGPTLPLTIALTSARPSPHGTAGDLGLLAYWGLTLTLTLNPNTNPKP